MRTVAHEILAHADRDPWRTALTTPDGDRSYGELAADIRALSRTLRAAGVGPETVCAVATGPGAEAVTAVAAVLHRGAAFLTLDVSQPPDRLAAFVRTGGATVLLTTSAVAPRLRLPLPAVLLDDPAPAGAAATAAGPPEAGTSATEASEAGTSATGCRGGGRCAAEDGAADPRALAYVSHTSGSTGEPSPVLVEHHSLDVYLRDTAEAFGLGPDTVALQLAPPGYDASIRDTFAPLLAGGRVVLADRARLLRPEEFARTVREFQVTALLSVTPSFLTHLAGQPGLVDPLAGVAVVASSGESLRPFLASGGRALVPGRLVNQYGPTECTMTTTRYEVPAGTAAAGAADLVGTPRAGAVLRLLDDGLRPVPDGAVGEVWIGGTGPARGYGGQPARTAACFVPDPYGPPGARLYRTGDLGRLAADGTLEYLGRTDRQVKIRGHRVDPAEIEGALLAHPRVSGAVVTAETDDRGRIHLLAHLTGDLAGLADAALRAHLVRLLPPHLMPRRFLRREALPTTRGGKADRRALAAGGVA